MKACIDPETCTGCGLCPELCPSVFEMGKDVAKVKIEDVPSDTEDSCREAADSCPVEAIFIKE